MTFEGGNAFNILHSEVPTIHSVTSEQVDLTSNEDFSQFLFANDDQLAIENGNPVFTNNSIGHAIEEEYVYNEFPVESEASLPNVFCDQMFSSVPSSSLIPQQSTFDGKSIGICDNICNSVNNNKHNISSENYKSDKYVNNISNNNNIYPFKFQVSKPYNLSQNDIVDHMTYSLNHQLSSGIEVLSSDVKIEENKLSPIKHLIGHKYESPGSDSGFSEETPTSKIVLSIPNMSAASSVSKTTANYKLAHLLNQSIVLNNPLNSGASCASTSSSTVKVVIPQSVLDNPKNVGVFKPMQVGVGSMSNSITSSIQHTTLNGSSTLKYLIPVKMASKNCLNNTISGSVSKVIKKTPINQNYTRLRGSLACKSVPASSLGKKATPVMLLPAPAKSEHIKLVRLANPTDNRKSINSNPKVIKVIPNTGHTGRVYTVNNTTSSASAVKVGTSATTTTSSFSNPADYSKMASEAIRTRLLKLSSSMSQEERKRKNVLKNHFICPGCNGSFALNRILLRSGGLYMQGTPQYCINCWDKIKKKM